MGQAHIFRHIGTTLEATTPLLTQFAQLNQTDLLSLWEKISITRMGSNEVVTAWIINCRLSKRVAANELYFTSVFMKREKRVLQMGYFLHSVSLIWKTASVLAISSNSDYQFLIKFCYNEGVWRTIQQHFKIFFN